MNDTDFQQRAYTNPWDDTEDFQAAFDEAPERRQLLDELQSLDQALLVESPPGLKQRLLELPWEQAKEQERKEEKAGPAAWSWWQWDKALPLAASVLLALSVALYFWPQSEPAANQPDAAPLSQAGLSEEVLRHIRTELGMLEADKQISLAQVNQRMDEHGGKFKTDDGMQVTDIKDCWVRGKALHLVMKSERGPVSVLIMGNAPVENEIPFEDERFRGVVTPTPRGNLAIVSENEEGITEIQQILASNITW